MTEAMSHRDRISLPGSALLSFKRELEKLEEILADGEELAIQAAAIRGMTNGILALTDERLLFIAAGILTRRFEEIPVEAIEEAKAGSGIHRGELELVAGQEKVRFVAVNPPERAAMIAGYLQARERFSELTESQPIPLFEDDPGELPEPPPATPQPLREAATLEERLVELHEAGILTDEELEAKRKLVAERAEEQAEEGLEP